MDIKAFQLLWIKLTISVHSYMEYVSSEYLLFLYLIFYYFKLITFIIYYTHKYLLNIL